MRHLVLLFAVAVVALVAGWHVHGYRLLPHRAAVKATKMAMMGDNKNALDRELDTFLERAAESGAAAVRGMTPNERAMRAIRGSEIEDAIFAAREELLQLEDDVFAGKAGADAKTQLADLRQRMNDLKNEYMEVVGANDLPLYFGKVADSMQ